MNNMTRLVIEIGICFILGIFISFFGDISTTFFNISLVQFYFYFFDIYFIFRIGISLLGTFLKYKLTGKYKSYSEEVAGAYLENSIYFKIMIICFFIIVLGVLRITFIILFIIFLLLYIFSYLSLVVNGTKNRNRCDFNECLESNEEIPYNFFEVRYNSFFGFELLKILTDNTFGILNNYRENSLATLLDKLSKSNYLFLVQRSMYFGDIEIFCGLINEYLNRLEIDIVIEKKDILSKDNNDLEKARDEYDVTLNNDLRVVDDILRKEHYRIISIALYDDSFEYLCISVVTDKVFGKLENLKKKYIEK